MWDMKEVDVCSFEEMLRNKGYLVYTAVGSSMRPFLRERRDVIEIRPTKGRCGKYDVILYRRGDLYILHRILRVKRDSYIIAGDNNTFVETDVTDGMILGVMTRVLRNGRPVAPDNMLYRLYVHLWCGCYPVRMMILRIRQKIRAALGKIKRKIL